MKARVSFLLRLCLPALLLISSAQGVVVTFQANRSASLGNPFIGFVPYAAEASSAAKFPHSMENTYIPWISIEDETPRAYNWTSLDTMLQESAGRGKQLIFRVFADYPGAKPAYAVPTWLRNGLSTCTYSEDGGGISPDYDNATLVGAMVDLVHALAARYDGDPRVGFIQIGLLGHWGEWHDESCPFASPATQATLLLAFNASFTTTRLLLRYADVSGGLNVSSLTVGLHDDSFGQDTIGAESWQFLQREVTAHATQQWQVAPIGGELRPELQLCIFAEDPSSACAGTGVTPQNFTACVVESHASWQWDYSAFSGSGYNASNGDLARALKGATLMGYAFTVMNVSVTAGGAGVYNVVWTVTNMGVAPVYYATFPSMPIVDATGTRTVKLTASLPFTALLPGMTLTSSVSAVPLTLPAQIGLSLSSPTALIAIKPTNVGVDGNGTLWTTISSV